jgi:hypothetical protein
MQDELRLIGYSIRNSNPIHLKFHKDDTTIVTMDQMLFPVADFLKPNEGDKDQASIITISHSWLGIFSSFEFVRVIFDNYKHESKLDIFGYAISENDLNILANVNSQYINLTPTDTIVIDDKWTAAFCGYDVMELDCIVSTLLNCEVDWKDAEVSGQLNSYNLFLEYSSASNFAKRCKHLVPEHYPCIVWGIWRFSK